MPQAQSTVSQWVDVQGTCGEGRCGSNPEWEFGAMLPENFEI